ncbi:MAG: hypothetical protein IIW48_13570 [Clostridia bacterium]|nr:hypothetical protein [Clostridia bacterium]
MSENVTPKKRTSNVSIIIGYALILAYVVVCVLLITSYALSPSSYYESGVEYYKEGNYEQAAYYFSKVDDYVPLEHYKNALDFYNDSAYRYACELIESGDSEKIETALDILYGRNGYETNFVESDFHNSRLIILRTADVGAEIYFAGYKWAVIDKNESGNLHLMCMSFVKEMQYQNNSNVDITTWANSSVRSWLNSGFYSSAFSSAQQKAIIKTYDNEFNCYDNVHIPTFMEFYNYVNVQRLSPSSTPEKGTFWTRDNIDSWHVKYAPVCHQNSQYKAAANHSSYSVRPAIWINPSRVTEI